MAEIIIAKHRNGAVGDIIIEIPLRICCFQNPDDEIIVPLPGEDLGDTL